MDRAIFHSLLFLWGTYIGLINTCQIFFTEQERRKLLSFYERSRGLYSLYSRYFRVLKVDGLRGFGVFSAMIVLLFSYQIIKLDFSLGGVNTFVIIVACNLAAMTLLHYYLLRYRNKYRRAEDWDGLFFINIVAFFSTAPRLYLNMAYIVFITLHLILIWNNVT